MTALRVLLSRLGGPFRKESLESDMDDELGFHLQMEIAENMRKGMSEEEARSASVRRFGSVAQVKEAYRETRALPVFEVLRQDVRYGLRTLRRSPGFSMLAILCLTLWIGATTSAFSWIEGVLLRPFPLVVHQERMMAIAGTNRGVAGAAGNSTDLRGPTCWIFRGTARCSTPSSWTALRAQRWLWAIGPIARP